MSSREQIKSDMKDLIAALGISEADRMVIENMLAGVPAAKQEMMATLIRDGMKMQKWNKDKMMYYGVAVVIVLALLGGAFYMGKNMPASLPFLGGAAAAAPVAAAAAPGAAGSGAWWSVKPVSNNKPMTGLKFE